MNARVLWYKLRALVGREGTDHDINDELLFHLEREARECERTGMSPEAARQEARRRFGGVERFREECRDVRRVSWLEDLRSDLRYAIRLVGKHRAFSLNVIAISALGIAACVTTFTLVSGILLAPLSFPEQDRVFSLELNSAEGRWAAIPAETYLRLAEGSPVFESVTATEPRDATVLVNDEPQRLSTAAVTASFFTVYRVQPFLGRSFNAEEIAQGAPVVLLGWDTWTTQFGSDREIVGRPISIDGASHTIIGVMPPRFLGNFEGDRFVPGMWVPLRVSRAVNSGDVNPTLRLATGVTRARAEAWLRSTVSLKAPSGIRTDSIAAAPILVPISEQIYGDVERPLSILLGAVLLVLLLVSANVATMFLARSVARQGEITVRAALGASAGRQLRQLITESVTLTAIGGSCGLAASFAAVSLIRSLGGRVLPRIDHVVIDWRVMAFALLCVIGTGCAGGLAHAVAARLGRSARPQAMTSGRVTGQRMSTALVLAQVALSVVLLVGAGLLMKGFTRIAPTNPGFALRNRATVALSLRGRPGVAPDDWAANRVLVEEVIDRMRRVGGVDDVAMSSFLPLTGLVSITDVSLSGSHPEGNRLSAYQNVISSDYFAVMEIPVVLGRAFTVHDDGGSEHVAVISETAARRWWPGDTSRGSRRERASPIGQRISLGRGTEREAVTVVGVVRGSRMSGRHTKLVSEIYLPLAQSHVSWVSFVAATRVPPDQVLPSLRRVVHEVAPSLPIMTATDLETTASESVSIERFYSVAMSMFAVAAVLLSALGVYGLLAFGVAQEQRAIGIRMALGASSGRIGRVVIGRAVLIGLGGVLIGSPLAFALSRTMQSLLREVTATDPAVFGMAGVAVFLVAVLAAGVPTYRAAHVDSVQCIRS